MKIVIAAGGTGGHIFPALSVALECRKRMPDVSILWIGTTRSREGELCKKYNIELKTLNVSGIKRALSKESINSAFSFAREVISMRSFFTQNRPDVILAFGGYVCAPVLAAARIKSIPYFLQEQNTVPGLVNRLFSKGALKCFLGFPLSEKWKLKGDCRVTGTPVRPIDGDYNDFNFPKNFNKAEKGILICGGSQGAASMNRGLVEAVKEILKTGIRVVWQTGKPTYTEILQQMKPYSNAFIFDTLDDLYPYYATANIVIGRSGASTLGETAYFGIPTIMIPLPWSAENHQWINAGLVESQGWGVRVEQNDFCGENVKNTVLDLLNNNSRYEKMCQKALDNSPINATSDIVTDFMNIIGSN